MKEKPIVPPKGPPVNLRPGGPHKQLKDIPRGEQKRRALKEQDTE